MRQYITAESIRANLHIVFGIRNDFFAKMLYGYLSNRVPNCNVNYYQFLKKLRPLWPTKVDVTRLEKEPERQREQRLKKEAKQRKAGIQKLIFDLCRIQGNEDITLVDLMQMSIYFPKEDEFGKEVHDLLDMLIDLNVRPRFVRS